MSVLVLVSLLCASVIGQAAPVTITFMAKTGGWEPLYREAIAIFESQNPDIKVDYLPETSDLKGKMQVNIAAGTAPDVFRNSGGGVTELALNGFLYDLNPLIKRDLSATDLRDFFPHMWSAGQLRYGEYAGLRFGIPQYANVILVQYNKEILARFGMQDILALDARGDWTWDTFRSYAKKLTVQDGNNVVQWGAHIGSHSSRHLGRPMWIWANGGDIFDFDNDPTRFLMDQPAAVEALDFVHTMMYQDGSIPSPSQRGTAKFDNGTLAIESDAGTENLRSKVESIALDWDMAPRPMGKAGRGNRTSSDFYLMSATTKHPEEAWRFLRFLTSREGAVLHAKHGYGPIRRSAARAYIEAVPGISMQVVADAFETARVDPQLAIVESDRVSGLISNALKEIFEQNIKPPRVALESIRSAIEAV